MNKGYINGDGRRVYSYYKQPYAWMISQMDKRLGKRPKNAGSTPVWAWKLWCNKERPDLRRSAHLCKGTEGAMVRFEIPDRSVLLSDFDFWHACLNDWYLSLSEREYDRMHEVFKNLPMDKVNKLKERSWIRMFNLKLNRQDNWWGTLDSVQATFWVLEKDMIQKTWFFKAR